jgi:hypothetical protein
MPSPTHPGPLGLVPLAGQYASTADIKAALQAHARNSGYAIVADSGRPIRAGWICSKGGKYNDKSNLTIPIQPSVVGILVRPRLAAVFGSEQHIAMSIRPGP